MTNPITPPPELIDEWIEQFKGDHPIYVAIQAAQWGADRELEACRMEIIDGAGVFYIDETSDRVRLAEDIWTDRRPKPPTTSLKEQALAEIDALENMGACNSKTIRRALEALPDD